MLKGGKVYGGANPRTLRTMSPPLRGGPPYPNWPLRGGEYPARRPGRSPPVGGALHQRHKGQRHGVFCQNGVISHGGEGKEITAERLAEVFLALQAQGAYNINLVTPTQSLPWILEALNLCGERLAIPVLYNTGGYERVEMLRLLEGRVQIYLPDLKYYDSALSARYSAAPDYFAVAAQALREMFRQGGPVRFDENGMLQSGMVVRHLVLPGAHKDSLRLLNWLADNFSPEDIRLSLMSQYTPPAGIAIRELQRPIFTYEYRKACERAEELGFLGYTQQRSSADAAYTPPFDGTGL